MSKVAEIEDNEESLKSIVEDNIEIEDKKEKVEKKKTLQTQEIILKNDNDKKINVDVKNLPFKKELGETVVDAHKIFKHYKISGREDTVKALNNIDLNDKEEFYSIKRGEFVMIRGPSGGYNFILIFRRKNSILNYKIKDIVKVIFHLKNKSIIGTIDKPSGGELKILGEKVSSKSR
jgi:ABC-type multidrug transport system fused ATPase/permease subunit